MTTETETGESVGLPDFPGTRSGRCPFDPPAEYAQWRSGQGLQQVQTSIGRSAWAVSRFEDAKVVLNDPRFSADAHRFPQLVNNAQTPGQTQVFPRMDDPEHARIRRMFTGEFTVKRVEALRPRIRELINGLLDEMTGQRQRPTDLVRAYALPVPSLVISLVLGVPYEDHRFFQEQSGVLNHREASREEKIVASEALSAYLLDLVDRKEREPGDDLISRLLVERVATGELSRRELTINCRTILSAGHETTANMIGLGTLALLENPEQAARVRDTDDPKLIAGAVEELLRYLSIIQEHVNRVATEDLTVGGQQVRAGDLLTVNVPAANRDTHFDDPDVFDIDRTVTGKHVAFGHGIHQCLGQTLARVEMQEALSMLLRRLPTLRLAVPLEEVRFRHDMATFGVHELPVTW
ncbi:cytochrome P450 [Streptomyces sp. NPDC051677]|uniref:cytochrome P450 n=1 Tax=Streptomyces sp. NPDC051677 TaxID=3365669 RepID=UPI0037CDF6F7